MEIKNANLNRLIRGLDQIGQLEITDFHLNLAIGRNITKLTSLWKSYTKSLSALVNKYVLMDEKGNPVIINRSVQLDKEGKPVLSDGEYDYNNAEDKKTYIKKKTELDEMINEVKLFELKTSALADVKGLTGVILFMLNELIVDDKNILGDEAKTDEKKTT